MSRILSLALAGTTAVGLSAGSFTAAQAAPMPALSAAQVAGDKVGVENVRYRGYGHGYGRGYGRGYYGGYRRGPGVGGALAAGAALGIIGGAIAASQAPVTATTTAAMPASVTAVMAAVTATPRPTAITAPRPMATATRLTATATEPVRCGVPRTPRRRLDVPLPASSGAGFFMAAPVGLPARQSTQELQRGG